MSTEVNKAIVRRWNQEIWRGNQGIFDEVLATDCVAHWMGGAKELKDTINRIRAVFSDIDILIEDQIAAEDRVATRWTLRGVHQGELWGMAPTGKRVLYKGITINRVVGRKIVEEWCESDLFYLMEQIGVIPAAPGKNVEPPVAAPSRKKNRPPSER